MDLGDRTNESSTLTSASFPYLRTLLWNPCYLLANALQAQKDEDEMELDINGGIRYRNRVFTPYENSAYESPPRSLHFLETRFSGNLQQGQGPVLSWCPCWRSSERKHAQSKKVRPAHLKKWKSFQMCCLQSKEQKDWWSKHIKLGFGGGHPSPVVQRQETRAGTLNPQQNLDSNKKPQCIRPLVFLMCVF